MSGSLVMGAAEAVGTRLAGRAALAALGPVGLGIGAAWLLYDGYQLYNAYNESHKETEDKPPEEACGDCGKSLPENPDELLDEGWEETSHPKEKENGRRRFKNPETGEEIIFDKGKLGQPGWSGRDHYHRPNPGKTNRHDEYLDKNGRPVRSGSEPSHIPSGTKLRKTVS
jgi:hypothetical protein